MFFCAFTCCITQHYKLPRTATLRYPCLQSRELYRQIKQHTHDGQPHLTSNVSFEDGRIDIDVKIHPFLQHGDDSLELRNVSQNLQRGHKRTRLSVQSKENKGGI